MKTLMSEDLERVSGGECDGKTGAGWLGCEIGYYIGRGMTAAGEIGMYF